MKPYYEDDYATIYHGDCLDIMPELPKVSMVLTDPPYNAENIGTKRKTYLNQVMKLPDNEYKDFCFNWFNRYITKCETLIFTPGIANTHNYPQPKWQLCWHKPAACSFNRMGGFNAWEPIFIYGNTKKVRLGQDYILCNTLNFKKGEERNHPCPKPINLIKKLLQNFLFDDDLVLDPFMGSGTTLRAAKDLGRKAIGIEIEERYCKIAVDRLRQEVLEF